MVLLSIADLRAEARTFLAAHASPLDRSVGVWGAGSDAVGAYQVRTPAEDERVIATARAWRRRKYDAGFGWISGPVAYGGRGLSLQHERAFLDEEASFDVPAQTMFGAGVGIVAPTILDHGDDALREEYLRPIHRGDVMACQLLSEPDAGSDLASVRTRAERDGESWVLNGQKVWSSDAHHASVGLLLARTNPSVAKHRGLTAFLLPTDLDGIEIRPLRQITGGAEFNEVYFTNVRLADRYRLGAVDGGWAVIRTTLGNERAAIGAGAGYGGAGLAGLAPPERIKQMLLHFGRAGEPVVRQDFARMYTGYEIARFTALRTAAAIEAGQSPGPWSATAKLALTTHMNESANFISRVLGPRFAADSAEWGTYAWVQLWLGVVGMRIGGGTDEILRNTVAEKVLGLPRD